LVWIAATTESASCAERPVNQDVCPGLGERQGYRAADSSLDAPVTSAVLF
jgi:hypothetical protein